MEIDILKHIETLAERSGKYQPQAYLWVLRVLEHTRSRLRRDGHLSGKELLEGHRELAVEEFGPMAYDVLDHWGVTRTEDVGEIVFDLVDAELLGKTEDDSMEDFAGVYDFREVFVDRFPW